GEKLGLEVEVLPGSWHHGVDANRLEDHLRADKENKIKAVLVVQVDTASSAQNDIARLRSAIDAAGHPALFMVDTIASLGTVDFRMDEWSVDVAVAGSQKGLMTPPGLSFVAASDKAKKAHGTADLVTYYWDWTFREGPEHYQKYCGTPPEHLLFGQRKALDMILEEGLDNVFLRHQLLCGAVHSALEVWSEKGTLSFNITEPADRAQSVTTVLFDRPHDPGALRQLCEETFGVTIGSTIGDINGKGIRIAHMGYVNGPMILGTLGALEVSLGLLNIPHGSGGLQKAADSLAVGLAK
ncbi:MAG: aminotransferase class V-fold PLP-dependent enzyme, partial [Stappiaceae bacterium]